MFMETIFLIFLIKKISDFLPKKNIKVIHSENNLIKVFLYNKKETKNKDTLYRCKVVLMDQMIIECDAWLSEILFLDNFIELFESEFKNINKSFYDNLEPVLFEKIPLSNIIYLLINDKGENVTNFYDKIVKEIQKNKITDKNESSIIIHNNFKNNSKLFKEKLLFLNDGNIHSWIFSNNSARIDNNRFKHIKKFMPINQSFINKTMNEKDQFSVCLKYNDSDSFDDLYKIITNNKKIIFEKELKKFIRENLFIVKKNYTILNYFLFEKLHIIFSLYQKKNLNNMKDLKKYLTRLDSISIDDNRSEVYLTNKFKMKENIRQFLLFFEGDPLVNLLKMNIPYHLIPDYINLLSQHSVEKINIDKEKRLYYFIQNLSKRVSEKKGDFSFLNTNKNFNKNPLNEKLSENLNIKSINTFQELYNIGIELNICAGNHETIDNYLNSYNFVVESNNKRFLGMIKNGVFKEFKGFKNSSPSFNLFQETYLYLLNNNYLDEEKNGNDLNAIYNKECIHKIYFN